MKCRQTFIALLLLFTLALSAATIEAASIDPDSHHKVSVDLSGSPSSLEPSINITVGERDGRVSLSVSRSSNTESAETLDYSTSDGSGLNACSSVTGLASSRCDYATTVGTLRYAPGETSKTVTIPLVDDTYAEGNETFSLTFSNPNGIPIGPILTFNITIIDNDASNGAPHPLNQTQFFVRQHYIDFLGREPDPAGFQGWQNRLNNCPPNDPSCDRIEVSSAFFRSEEFQSRGYFIYRFYSAVLGRVPHYNEFIPDFAKLSGFLTPDQLEENKLAFVQEFMNRPEFRNHYATLTTPTAYVDGLLQAAGLPAHPSRGFWIGALTNQTMTRAQVLRAVVESSEVYLKFYTEGFVIMQYFGYLRRDADASYLNWIQTMNQNGGDYRLMINGFLNSIEYRQRFGD